MLQKIMMYKYLSLRDINLESSRPDLNYNAKSFHCFFSLHFVIFKILKINNLIHFSI